MTRMRAPYARRRRRAAAAAAERVVRAAGEECAVAVRERASELAAG